MRLPPFSPPDPFWPQVEEEVKVEEVKEDEAVEGGEEEKKEEVEKEEDAPPISFADYKKQIQDKKKDEEEVKEKVCKHAGFTL